MPLTDSFRRAGIAAGGAVLAVLSGCATTTIAADPLKTPPAAHESVVAVSLTANTAQVAGFDEITVRKIFRPSLAVASGAASAPPDEYFVLYRKAPGMARDTSLYVGVLPAGEYEFSKLRDRPSLKSLALGQHGAGGLEKFTVVAGKPVDLGRLIITPLNEKVLTGRSAKAVSNKSLIDRFAPAHAALFTGETDSGWANRRPSGDRVEEYALQRPVGADCVTELKNGDVAMASRLGSVLVRSASGQWRVLRGPGIESLLCLTEVQLDNADLLAVGEFGTLLRHAPGSDQLLPIAPGNLPAGSVLRIAGNSRAGWFIALQRDSEISLLHSRQLEDGNWTVIRTERTGLDFWHGVNRFWMESTDDGFFYAVSAGPIHVFSFAGGTWSERALPGNRLLDLRRNANGSLSALTGPGGGFGGITASLYLSKDQGRTWGQVNGPFAVKLAPVVQGADGTLFASSVGELQKSADEGKTWKPLGEYFPGRVLHPLKSGGLLDVDTGIYGSAWIRYSSNNGGSWVTEYSNYDRRAADVRKATGK